MSTTFQLTGLDVQEMARHWLHTPVCGYLGSDYGQDGKSMLQRPLSDTRFADEFIAKLRRDVPVFNMLPSNAAEVSYKDTYPDKRAIVLKVIEQEFEITKR